MKMQRHVAFLRGINLGRRRLKMAELRRVFEELGLGDVATYIASGNVVFDHPGSSLPELEARIEAHLGNSFGFPIDTFVRPLAELGRLTCLDLVESARTDGFNIHVIFLRRQPGPDIAQALRALEGPDDRFHARGREMLWLRRGRLSDSPVKDRDLQKALGAAGNTMRNLNTVQQLVVKFG